MYPSLILAFGSYVYYFVLLDQLTRYKLNEVLGRNCRFLQGPETDPRAVDKIRTVRSSPGGVFRGGGYYIRRRFIRVVRLFRWRQFGVFFRVGAKHCLFFRFV